MVTRFGTPMILTAVVLLSGCAPAAVPIDAAEPAESQTSTSAPAEPTLEAATEQPKGNPASFTLDPNRSEVRFVIGEILAGEPNTVVGVNRSVSGVAEVVLDQPAASQLGEFTIQATEFQTDSNLRDRAINQFILQSSAFPVIRFRPSSIAGLPEAVSPGDTLDLQIEGELVIREIAQPVVFATRLTVVSVTELSGRATTTISRSDFQLQIPQVPRVAGVDEELILEFDFVLIAG